MTELLRMVRVMGPAMSPFAAATLTLVSMSTGSWHASLAADYVEIISADPEGECQIVDQAVNNALMPEELSVLVKDIPSRLSDEPTEKRAKRRAKPLRYHRAVGDGLARYLEYT
jgi:hypothetical protein